jgi:hypothetical protein
MRLFATAIVLLVAFAASAAAQPGTPVKTGKATFTVGSTATAYDKVSGNLADMSGYIMATVTFASTASSNGDHLTVSVLMKGPGAVDLNQPMGNGVGYWKGGTIYQYEKGKSQCAMTVTVLTAAAIEGTATCPVLHEQNGAGTLALTNVKFSATTK